ncbi:TPA: YopX family protein [Streptococcus agalactiae]
MADKINAESMQAAYNENYQMFLAKNDVEIFEGDIVKLRYTITSDFELFKVNQFRGGSWRIDNRRRGSELWLRKEVCEVVGNIYENPELLESVGE